MPRRTHRTGKPAPRARLALWAGVLALLVQALLPAAAMAAASRAAGGEQIVICTQTGVRTIAVGAHEEGGKGFAGLPCDDCLAATVVATPAPEPELARAVYAGAACERAPERSWAPRLARAPPRPPGQGPPRA